MNKVSIPVEIFSEIMQYLDDILDESTIHSLSRCCLLLVPLCQPRIYRRIRLDSANTYLEPLKTHTKMMRLEENFKSSPHLATYVRSFEIWLWDGWISNRPHPGFFHLLSKITARLAHVRTLMIYGTEIHSKSNQPYVDWKQITGNLDPDIQDTGIAIEKMLVGERLRYLETRGILNFPFTRFLERCRVVELTDGRAHNIAICAVEMFRDPTLSNATPSVRSYTLSRIVCMDRRIMAGIETACAHARNPSGPLSVNLSTMTTLTVTWNKDYDIKETKKLILLGRSIEILSIIGEETISSTNTP